MVAASRWTAGTRTGLLLAALAGAAPAGAQSLERLSTTPDGQPAGGYYPALSADGRVVAFVSESSRMVAGDTNETADVFVYDRESRSLERVTAGGTELESGALFPLLSADGRFVSFSSSARNAVPGDTNDRTDTFVYDRTSGTLERVSLGPDGVQGNGESFAGSLSADGRFVAFASYAGNFAAGDENQESDVFVRDRASGTTLLVSAALSGGTGNGTSYDPQISADGSAVVFISRAADLVPGDTNGHTDVFVWQRESGAIERVNLAPDGSEANWDAESPSISADGLVVAFGSHASNLVPGDLNYNSDVFIVDRTSGQIELASVTPEGYPGSHFSSLPQLSGDGRSVIFASLADDLVASGDTNHDYDAYVYDRASRRVERVSVGTATTWELPPGGGGAASAGDVVISADGRIVAFSSNARLRADDVDGLRDVYVRDRQAVLPPDSDLDDDGHADAADNCPSVNNPDQADENSDGFGDACVPPGSVDPRARLGANPVLRPGSSLARGAQVGDGAVLGEGAALERDAVAGNGLRLGNSARVGPRAVLGEDVFVGAGAVIGQGARIGAGAVIEDGASVGRDAVVEAGARVLALAAVDRDVVLGERARVGRWCTVARGSTLGARAALEDGVVLARDSSLGALARVRESARIGRAAVIGEGARIGLSAVLESNVTVGPGAIVPDYTHVPRGTHVP